MGKGEEVIILSILAFPAIGISIFLLKEKNIVKEKYFLFFMGFIIFLFSIIYCVSFLDYDIGGIVSISQKVEKAEKQIDAKVEKGEKQINAKVEKAKKEVDVAVEINRISQLGSRSRWQNVYGGDRRSYESLLALEKIKAPEISKIFSSEMEAIESVYNVGNIILWIEQPIAICKYTTERPCSEGFEPPIGYNADNVFNHLVDRPLWHERARAACLLRNVRNPQNTNKDGINNNKEEFYNKLVSRMKKEEENSLFVSVMALNTYKELTGYPSSGIFDFDGAIKDWNDPKRKEEILKRDF